MQQVFDSHTTEGKVKVIIKVVRRAKNEVGKRSKSKQLDKVIVAKVSFPSNTNSGLSPWHYYASVSAQGRQTEDSMPKKPWKESVLALFYNKFPAKISFSRAFQEP